MCGLFLDLCHVDNYKELQSQNRLANSGMDAMRTPVMFDDLFNFAKQRNLKQSIGFYLFYVCLFMGFSGFMTLLGL